MLVWSNSGMGVKAHNLLDWYSLSTFVQTVSESSVQDSDEERPESYKQKRKNKVQYRI